MPDSQECPGGQKEVHLVRKVLPESTLSASEGHVLLWEGHLRTEPLYWPEFVLCLCLEGHMLA